MRIQVRGGRFRRVGHTLSLSFDPPRSRRGGGNREIHPWQPIRTGPFTFTLRKGFVFAFDRRSISPSNMNATFTCPANVSSGFFVWLVGNFSDVPNLTSLSLASGTTLPVGPTGDATTGAPPAVSYCPLLYATSTEAGIDSIVPLTQSILKVEEDVVSANCAANQRVIRWRSLDGSLLA